MGTNGPELSLPEAETGSSSVFFWLLVGQRIIPVVSHSAEGLAGLEDCSL